MAEPNFDPTSDTEAEPDGHQGDTGEPRPEDEPIPEDEAVYEWHNPVVGYVIIKTDHRNHRSTVKAKEIVQHKDSPVIGDSDADHDEPWFDLHEDSEIVGTIPAPEGIFVQNSEDEPHGTIDFDKFVTPGETTVTRAEQPEESGE